MKLERCENGHVYNAVKYKECPYCNSDRLEDVELRDEAIDLVQDDGDKTVAYWANELDVEPVVGWIVCISGYDKGKDFKLKTEKNFIGRGPEMDVCISGDNSITRKNHAIITYNPKQRVFMILPGEGTGIVYVQNDAVYSPRQLTSYDVIEIGNSKFVFIALCGDNFDWKIEK